MSWAVYIIVCVVTICVFAFQFFCEWKEDTIFFKARLIFGASVTAFMLIMLAVNGVVK